MTKIDPKSVMSRLDASRQKLAAIRVRADLAREELSRAITRAKELGVKFSGKTVGDALAAVEAAAENALEESKGYAERAGVIAAEIEAAIRNAEAAPGGAP